MKANIDTQVVKKYKDKMNKTQTLKDKQEIKKEFFQEKYSEYALGVMWTMIFRSVKSGSI